MKEELLKTIEELRNCIYEIEDIGWQEWKDSEDYDRADELRNLAMLDLGILKKAIDKYVNV